MKIFLFIISITAAGLIGYLAIKSNTKNAQSPASVSTSTVQKTVKPAATKSTQPTAQSLKSDSQKSTTTYLSNIPDSQIPAGFKREQLSPYFKEIKISSASYSSSITNPSQIRINSYFQDKNKTINVSGWQIKSNRYTMTIPQAINNYDPSGLSNETDIFLGANNYLILYSNTSAINKNLRLNKCIGYLENFYKFTPSLPMTCPPFYQNRSEIANFAGYCQTYIMSIGSCKLPSVNYYNSLPGTDEGNACRNYLSPIGYASCFQKHKNDGDFLSKEFKTWVNQNILDSQHDRLRLFDKDGLLADEYIY